MPGRPIHLAERRVRSPLLEAFAGRNGPVVAEAVTAQYGGKRSRLCIGMMYSILCYDAGTRRSWDKWQDTVEGFRLVLASIEFFLQSCDDRHRSVRLRRSGRPISPTTDNPTVVVAGEFDPIT